MTKKHFSRILLFLSCFLLYGMIAYANVWEGPEYVLNEEGNRSDYVFWVEKNENDQVVGMKATMYYHSSSTLIRNRITVRYRGVYYDEVPVTKVIGDSDLEIQHLAIPEGILEVEGFQNCDRLEQISLPDGLVGMNAFADCSALKELRIPDTVTTLIKPGDKAVLKSIVWPAGIPEIGSHFFDGYTALERVELSSSLKEIGAYAFAYASALTNIELPQSLEAIGEYAFYKSGITQLSIPDSVTILGTLGMNTTLQKVVWPAGIPVVPARAFQDYSALEEVIISEGVTEIADYNSGGTFTNCTKLKSVTLPTTLRRIGSESFEGDISLTEVKNIEYAEEIGNRAFKNCSSLTELTLGAKSIENNAFHYATSLEKVTLSDGMESIGTGVFRDTKVTELCIPDTVTSLGLFEMQDLLKKVVWPAGVTTVPVNAFHRYSALEEVIISEGVTELADYHYGGTFTSCTNLRKVTLPTTLRKIGNESFEGDISLTEIYNLEYVQEIGNRAFKDCPCPNTLTIGARTIEWEAFRNASGLKNITLSDGLESIGNNAFTGTCIEDLSLPDSVTSLGILGMADTLKRVVWPAGIKVIPVNSFNKYTVLEEVIISEGVTELADYNYGGTFTGCTKLKKVTLPTTLRRIGNESFEGDISLVEINNLESVQEIGNRAFKNCPCPDTLTIGAETIEWEAFQNAKELKHLTLLRGVETIGDNVFAGTGIANLELPDTVTTLGTLGMAESLKRVVWTAGIEVVPVNSFHAYGLLEEVILPEGVTAIADYNRGGAFTRCSNLESVSLPASLSYIGTSAFAQCTSLTDIYCTGAYEDWIHVSIESDNEPLQNAKCHFTYDYVHCIVLEKEGDTLVAEIDGNVKAKGMICSSNTAIPTLDTPGIIQYAFTEVSPEGTISMDSLISDGYTWRAYIIYDDENGDEVLLYSQIQN